ncbi:PAS domain-containing protein [Mesorhizobium sp. B283B1A]|uniref:sensor histidine kinase n=1 Tax=Mesorhizobium TaxID=68287 RepID=UPI001CD16791|nr:MULTISPECIES: ATP-binding protein [Mesorhizobium]MCA0046300.1 PAS domain-containing protein [Mesorhizobium sp. B283B1A]UQS62784.1 ATP-binding protein [Mesorhizobium opportunistum]
MQPESTYASTRGGKSDRGSPKLRRSASVWRLLPDPLRGIGGRLLVRVLIFSSVITLLLTLAQLYLDYRSDVQAIDQKMSEIDSSYRQSLSEGLWEMDGRQLQLQVDGILRLPNIRYVELRETTDQAAPLVVTAGSRQPNPPERHELKIYYSKGDARQLLGILAVEATYDEIYRQLLNTAATIMVAQAIKTFMVSFFILFTVHRLVTRHITAIGTSLRGYDLRGSQEPLRLQRRPSRPSDELDFLVGAFNQMWRGLQQAYDDLQLQVGLLQRLPVSAWTLKPDGTPDFVNQVWLEFAGQTLDFARSHPEAWMTAIHPDDRAMAVKSFWEGVHSGQDFAMETRSLRARDGAYRWHLQQAVVLRDSEGKLLRFVGTTTDIDDLKRAEEALRQAQGDLARINRVTTMGELAASLAHEVTQPITGALTNATVCLRGLDRDQPDYDQLRTAVNRMVRDAQRAADILKRIRSQFERGSLDREVLDLNEINRGTVALLRDQAARYKISVRTELATDLPRIAGDRVQLQQVAMNLIVNSIEAMKSVDGVREIVVKSQRVDNHILVSVSDTGPGFPQDLAEQIFDPFFTTKPDGTGMGLRVARSIIESHGGRMWAIGSHGRGATFHLSLPFAISVND